MTEMNDLNDWDRRIIEAFRYVFAGNRGAPTNPNWYHNLVAHPDVAVELGTEKFEARATVVDSAEGDRLGSIQLQKLPGLAELQREDHAQDPRCSAGTQKGKRASTREQKGPVNPNSNPCADAHQSP